MHMESLVAFVPKMTFYWACKGCTTTCHYGKFCLHGQSPKHQAGSLQGMRRMTDGIAPGDKNAHPIKILSLNGSQNWSSGCSSWFTIVRASELCCNLVCKAIVRSTDVFGLSYELHRLCKLPNLYSLPYYDAGKLAWIYELSIRGKLNQKMRVHVCT